MVAIGVWPPAGRARRKSAQSGGRGLPGVDETSSGGDGWEAPAMCWQGAVARVCIQRKMQQQVQHQPYGTLDGKQGESERTKRETRRTSERRATQVRAWGEDPNEASCWAGCSACREQCSGLTLDSCTR